jgi:hypothetical protein
MLAADGLSVVQERQKRLRRGESFYRGQGIVSKGRSSWHGQVNLVKAVPRCPLCVLECKDLEHRHGLDFDMPGVSPESRNTITARSAGQGRKNDSLTKPGGAQTAGMRRRPQA